MYFSAHFRAAAVFTLASFTSTPLHAIDFRTVALSADPAPGSSFNFQSLEAPILNNNGDTAFIALLDNFTTSGLWSEGLGSLAKVALRGEPAPDAGGQNFGFFNDSNVRIFLNDAGQTAFAQQLSTFNTFAIYSQTGAANALRKVAKTGDTAPGTTDPNRVFSGITPGGFNDSGQAAFHSAMPPTASPPGNFPSSGIWSEGSGSLAKVAEVGQNAPGTPANFFEFRIPAINNNGHVAYVAQIITGGSGEGVWSNRSGSLARIVGNGDAAPGGGTFSILFNDTVAINDNGDIAFSANLNVTVADGIWAARNGIIEKVAVEGDTAPATGGATFPNSSLGIASDALGLDADGNVAFVSGLSDGRRALFSESFGGLHPVAITGDTAPDMGGLTFQNILRWTINAHGRTAFQASLSGSSAGIFAQDDSGVLQKIVAEGDILEVAPGDFRQIEFLSFHGLNGSSGGHADNSSSGFNNDGAVAFFASFDDGSSGVFTTILNAFSLADFNQDGFVDGADFSFFLGQWGATGGLGDADFNSDNTVDGADFSFFLAEWNPPPPGLAFIPEPTSAALLVLGGLTFLRRR